MAFIDEVWLRKAHRALKETLEVDDQTKRQMVQFLLDEGFWDANSLKWESAVARFNDNNNPTKASYWKIGEVWALMLRFGRHDLAHAIAESLGYELRPIPTEERRQALLHNAVSLLERLHLESAELRQAIERLATAPLERPIPALAGGRAHFSAPTTPTDDPRTAVERIGPL